MIDHRKLCSAKETDVTFMTGIQILRPPRMHPAPAFLSPGSIAGGIVFLGGQVALDEDGQVVGVEDIRLQTVQALKNLESVLVLVGGTFRNVASITAYLRHVEDYEPFNEEYERFSGGWSPPRATVACELMNPEFLVEIQGIAVLAGPDRTESPEQHEGVER